MAEAQVAVAAVGGESISPAADATRCFRGRLAPRPGGGRALPELRRPRPFTATRRPTGDQQALRADATEYFDMVLVEDLDARPERGTARMNEPSSKQGVTRPWCHRRHRRPRDPRQPRQPTVECDVLLEKRHDGPPPPVPSGASTGSREAIELRDGDKGRYLGKGRAQRPSSTSTPRSAKAVLGLDAASRPSSTRPLIDLDGTDKEPPRRQRDARGEHGRRPRRGRGVRPAAVPLLRRLGRHADAGADDERHQRRRTRTTTSTSGS